MVLNKGSTRLPVLSRPGHTDRTLGIYLLTRPVLLLLHGIQNILGILTAHAARSLLLSGLPFRPGVIPGTSAVVPVVGAVVPVGVVPVIRTVISTLVTVLRPVPILLPVAVAVLISILVLVLVLVLIPVVASAALLLLLFEQFLDIRKIVFRFKVGRIFTKRLLVEIGRLFQFLLCEHVVAQVVENLGPLTGRQVGTFGQCTEHFGGPGIITLLVKRIGQIERGRER